MRMDLVLDGGRSVLSLAGWYHVLAYGLLIPLLALRTKRKLTGPAPLPDRKRHYLASALTLAALSGYSVWVAHREWIDLLPRRVPSVPSVALGLATYAGAVLAMRPKWRKAIRESKRVTALFTPQDAVERAWWVLVSFLAGIGEEITWRGVQVVLLARLTGDLRPAALLAALSFGAAHAVQGWRSAALIGVFALWFSGLAWLSGSLAVGMAVHVAYDVTAGLHYAHFARELAPARQGGGGPTEV